MYNQSVKYQMPRGVPSTSNLHMDYHVKQHINIIIQTSPHAPTFEEGPMIPTVNVTRLEAIKLLSMALYPTIDQ